MRRLAVIAGAALLALPATAALAGNNAAGQQKSAPCQACHGADGNGVSPQYPRLAGQHADYLAQALRQYQTGQRKNAIMAPFAAPLSQRDMEDLAAYYAQLPNGVFRKP